jgi:hypothetical protein
MATPARQFAHARAVEHVRDAATALGLDLDDLVPAYAQTMDEDPGETGPPGRIFVALRWWLPIGTRNGPAFDTLARHWLARGYRLLGDGRGDPLPYLWAEDPADGYRLGLEGNVQGRLLLGASSPLFWPDGDGLIE